jgi:hypothetical protein
MPTILNHSLREQNARLEVIDATRKKPPVAAVGIDSKIKRSARDQFLAHERSVQKTAACIRINRTAVEAIIREAYWNGRNESFQCGYERGVADGVRLVSDRRGPTPQPPTPATTMRRAAPQPLIPALSAMKVAA